MRILAHTQAMPSVLVTELHLECFFLNLFLLHPEQLWVSYSLGGVSELASCCTSELLIAVGSLIAEHELQVSRVSVVVAHVLSCPAACGIFLDQGSNLCPLHQQADSLPPDHQGSPKLHSEFFSVSNSHHQVIDYIIQLVHGQQHQHHLDA